MTFIVFLLGSYCSVATSATLLGFRDSQETETDKQTTNDRCDVLSSYGWALHNELITLESKVVWDRKKTDYLELRL